MLVPITMTTSALFVAIGAFAKDFKDGQNFLTPVYMLLVMPAGVTMLPSVELNAWTAFVPVVNIALLVKSLFAGEVRADLLFLVRGGVRGLRGARHPARRARLRARADPARRPRVRPPRARPRAPRRRCALADGRPHHVRRRAGARLLREPLRSSDAAC